MGRIFETLGIVIAILLAGYALYAVICGPTWMMYGDEAKKYKRDRWQKIKYSWFIWYGIMVLMCLPMSESQGFSFGLLGDSAWLDFILLFLIPYFSALFYAGGYLSAYSDAKKNGAGERYVPTPTFRKMQIDNERKNGVDPRARKAMDIFNKNDNEKRRQKRADQRRKDLNA